MTAVYACRACASDEVEQIDAALLSGVSLRAVTRQFDFLSKDILARHLAHIAPEVKRATASTTGMPPLELAQRLADSADDAREARIKLLAAGRYREAARLADVEARALATLADRLGVDDLTQLALRREADALTAAIRHALAAAPPVLRVVADHLVDEGFDELAEQLRGLLARHDATPAPVPVSASAKSLADTPEYIPARPLPADDPDLNF